jgi:D-alanyl-D-alanine carboxypeptidase/D-alanyl-D-alanine-endopeptidase (penicillin-binding protein 4)
MTNRSWVLGLLVVATTVPISAQTDKPWCDRVKAMTAEPAVAGAHWGVSVTALDGTPLCAIDAGQLFRPASNAKLFTVIPALSLLGSDLRVQTTVIAENQTSKDIVAGDLRLVGAGDANLSERRLPYAPAAKPGLTPGGVNPLETLADAVAASGIQRVKGDIVGDDSAWPFDPYPPGWPLDDTLWGYGAPVSALSIDDNHIALTVLGNPDPGKPAIVIMQPDLGWYTVQNDVATVSTKEEAKLGIDRQPGSRRLRVFGKIPVKSQVREELAIDDPADFSAHLFKTLLEARGIHVDGIARAVHRPNMSAESTREVISRPLPALPGQPVTQALNEEKVCLDDCRIAATYRSPPMLEDVTVTLKTSQNLHAELLLRQLAHRYGRVSDDPSDGTTEATTAQGARVVRQFWLNAGVAPHDFVLFDGSGLSPQDLVTPRALTQVLVFATKQPWFAGFKAALPVGGVDGSLAGRFTGTLKGRVFAKTGTLGESRALSGYVTTATGQTVVFSILVDNHLPGSSADRVVMDRMVEVIAASN